MAAPMFFLTSAAVCVVASFFNLLAGNLLAATALLLFALPWTVKWVSVSNGRYRAELGSSSGGSRAGDGAGAAGTGGSDSSD
jgi:hypothetical protein